jgi:HlyD family secretion protein
MELLVTRYKPWIMIILLVLLVSFAIYRWWQGPLLPSYEVVSSPLIQTVVASGRVEKVSRTQIGSEITGVVLELGSRGRFISRGMSF